MLFRSTSDINNDRKGTNKLKHFINSLGILFATALCSTLVVADSQTASYRLQASERIPYGNTNNSLGLKFFTNSSPLSPESFCTTPSNKIYICDNANKRLVVYDLMGKYQGEIPCGAIHLSDVAVYKDTIFIYDDVESKVFLLDMYGAILDFIAFDTQTLRCRGTLHISCGRICITNTEANDLVLGSIKDRKIEKEALPSFVSGVYGDSGRRYVINLNRGKSFGVSVYDTSDILLYDVAVEDKNVLSCSFLGEDSTGCFYVQTESLNEKVTLSCHKFESNNSAELTSFTFPDNRYIFWTTRLLDCSGAGDLIQFLPQEENALLNIYSSVD